MKLQLKVFMPVLFSLILFFTLSCGSGGGEDCEDSTVDISGTWTITETTSTSSSFCAGDDGVTRTITVTVVQSGSNITVTVGSDGGELAGAVFSGSICADISDWSGSYEDDGGTTTVTGADITATDTSFTGTTTWTFTDGTNSCTGTTTLTGTRS